MKKYLFTIMTAVIICSCSQQNTHQSLHSVMTTIPKNANCEMIKNFSGIVKENAETNLGFKTAGQIEKILVKEGDHVRTGQLLAVLDDEDYRLGVEALQVQYDQTKAEVNRMKLLFEGNSISANDYEKAESGLQQLGIQLQINKNKLKYTRLEATADAIVKSVNFERSEMVDAGTAVFTLLDIHSMEIEINIPYEIYLLRNQFDHISCTANGNTYPLQLKSIVPKADNTQLFTAKLSIKEHLTAGQTVDVIFHIYTLTGDSNKVFSVPLHAVFEDNGKSFVWIVTSDSTVVRREVSIKGVDTTGDLLLSSGLDGSETIVRAGVNALKDDEKVKIIAQPSKTNIGGLI